jgi:tungstate transport system ATP-binding protein
MIARDLVYRVRSETLISGLCFELRPGGTTVLLGASGAGKSLTLRLCHGLLRPSAGTISWNAPVRGTQAMVFQRPVMLRRSALANVTYALGLRGIGRAERRARAATALERVGLAPVACRHARALSAGEQQRLALARAWALEPEVLFLDEPTASLDPTATRAVEEIIRAIRDFGTKIVMTTHDLGQARRFADEVLFLHGGRLVESGPSDAFFDRPRTPEARAFARAELPWEPADRSWPDF